ncbi:TRAP transporter large permease subunit [Methylibium sp.]|uniref:TRAP transporter large permease n=1 Tax=Methylibium sp. TaxID=2067992 RepID=UPI0017D9CE05|nr:TRAP transporter large permease subunit [Methylibium sp.]MBA3589088.1 TRAP transporter large permease subunit [Methylibium sp.]
MPIVDLLPVLMFVTLGVLLFSGYPVGFVLGGIALFFGVWGHLLDVFPLIQFFNIPSRIFGVASNSVLVAIPMFIFMGTMLEKSGAAKDLLFCLQVMLRRVPGGLALSVTLMGTIMAATTGIVGASVIMLTLLALPTMLAQGYNKELATGTIGASGTLGILIPPSIMLVIMADMLATSVGFLFVAAVLPGLLLALFYLLYICTLSFLKPHLAPPLSRDIGPASASELFWCIARGFVPVFFLVFLVLGSILFGWATPTEASGVGAFGATLLALFKGKLTFRLLNQTLQETALTNAMLFLIFVGATAFSYVFRALGGDFLVVGFVEGMGFGPWGLLILLMAVVFFLGFFFDWLEITLIALPIFAPMIELLDFGSHVSPADLMPWFAILLAVNLQTSYLTPPFGITLFYMKGIAPPEVKIGHIYRGIAPFVLLQLTGLALVIIYPEIALWLPKKLLG